MSAGDTPWTMDLFADDASSAGEGQALESPVQLAQGAALLRGFAITMAGDLWRDIANVLSAAPLRHMVTPGGLRMSVAMSNCGALGWVSDRRGYRYDAVDPDSGQAWPAMPASFSSLAGAAAERAGFAGFVPDACLINRYQPGARLSLHQDRDERDFAQPIVSMSLGLPAVFLFGGLKRSEPAVRVSLAHGDVVVWGGSSRLRHHGVLALKPGWHALTGACRVNLTFRCAG
jgi:alkylated DNA repair protein (DNA oxidative demethylase)